MTEVRRYVDRYEVLIDRWKQMSGISENVRTVILELLGVCIADDRRIDALQAQLAAAQGEKERYGLSRQKFAELLSLDHGVPRAHTREKIIWALDLAEAEARKQALAAQEPKE